ncbi:hypothetical protein [Agromyces bracchium]|uniref:Uncharacterized protein n=1 Tax=Agromyces bracchium TaxID=88376 RepID=A0A6I3M4G7_9MICO|nr:hypothetical protein [Agromyces bracchium]MTH68359.1 hypothetical protein [Agromyces bracchium]
MLTPEAFADAIGGSDEKVGAHSRYEIDPERMFARTGLGWRTCVGFFWGALFVLAIVVFLWFAVSDGDVAVIFGIPAPGLLILSVGLLAGAALALAPNLHRRLGIIATAHCGDMFVIGATPLAGTYLVVTVDRIVAFDRRETLLGRWRAEEIDAVALKQFGNAVGAVLFTHDRCFELSISARAGGPFAPAWSTGGALGRTQLRSAIEASLQRCGIPAVTSGPVAG